MILVVEGMQNSYSDSFVRKVLGKTEWPFYNYAPEHVDTYNQWRAPETAWYRSRDALVYSFEQNDTKDVVVANLCFEVVASGIVERGWNAMTTIRSAESLFKRLSDMGAVHLSYAMAKMPLNRLLTLLVMRWWSTRQRLLCSTCCIVFGRVRKGRQAFSSSTIPFTI